MPKLNEDLDKGITPRNVPEKKAQGWGAVNNQVKETEERKEQYANKLNDIWWTDGETIRLQIVEEDPHCMDTHGVKNKHHKFVQVPCQHGTQRTCTLCNEGSKTSFRAAFLILDYRGGWNKEAKAFDYDLDNATFKRWLTPLAIAQQLESLKKRSKIDLTGMVLDVTRTGTDSSTKYNIERAIEDGKLLDPLDLSGEEFPSLEEACKPYTDDMLDAEGIYIPVDPKKVAPTAPKRTRK